MRSIDTADVNHSHKQRFGCREKIRVDSERGKRNIRHLAQSAKARRNCSLTIYQTICVGTQSDMDLNVLGRKMNTKSQE